MIVDPTFRLVAYREAKKCMRMVDQCDVSDPEFWANLIGAVVNTNIACIPDSVAAGLVHESMEESLSRDHVKKKVREAQHGR